MRTARPASRPRTRERSDLPASPKVVISLRGVNRLKAGHVWIYRSDLLSTAEVGPGAVVAFADERGRFFGSALYSSSSQITLRMLSERPVSDLPELVR